MSKPFLVLTTAAGSQEFTTLADYKLYEATACIKVDMPYEMYNGYMKQWQLPEAVITIEEYYQLASKLA